MNDARNRAAIVVGAGPAGLASSRGLVRYGVDHAVLERGRVGESWRRYYDGLVPHTGRHLSSLPGIPFLRNLVGRDGRGFARRTDRITSADQHGLFFVGHEYDASGGLNNIRRDAPVAARLAASWLAGSRAGGRTDQ